MTEEIENKIFEIAVREIHASFKLIQQECIDETIYGFGLGLVGDLTGFFTAANTLEALRSKKKLDVSDFWYISEWKYEGKSDGSMYRFLSTFIDDIKDEAYDSVMRGYEQVLIKALQTCDEAGLFGVGEKRKEIVVYLHYADATDEDIDDVSSKEINPPALHNLFKERWNEEVENLTKVIQRRITEL